jgi:hypothetical protein
MTVANNQPTNAIGPKCRKDTPKTKRPAEAGRFVCV